MPPIDFKPTHQSPFKSTLSSAQQSKANHSSSGATSIQHRSHSSEEEGHRITAENIDPAEWRYHAEGGKNLLLSYIPQAGSSTYSRFVLNGQPLALRIQKTELHAATTSGEAVKDDEEAEAELFATHIIAPLLGTPEVLPLTFTIPLNDARDRNRIDTLAASAEIHRPLFRRSSPARIHADTLTCVHAVEDITAPLLVHSEAGLKPQDTLCIEIKPKWGFIPKVESLPPSSPNLDIKVKYSRYKMHRVARAVEAGSTMSLEQFEALYDPLDLYSPKSQRKEKAIRALWNDWKTSNGTTNNLRLFWNGQKVAVDDEETLASIATFLGTNHRESDSILNSLSKLLVSELSRKSVSVVNGGIEKRNTLLERIAYLQATLDPMDVEGLAELWLQVTGSSKLGHLNVESTTNTLHSTLTTPPTLEETQSCISDLISPNSSSTTTTTQKTPTEEAQLRRHIHRFLLSSTFKDCSLLIRCNKSIETGGSLQTSTKVIDLDMKPISKLAKFQATDQDICATFLKWKAGLEREPPASLAP